MADDFDFVVGAATGQQQPQQQTQPQQTPIQQHFNANSVTWVIPWPEGQVAPENVNNIPPVQQQPMYAQPAVMPPQQPIVAPAQPAQQPAPEQQPAPTQQPAPVNEKPQFNLNQEIDNLLSEFGIETKPRPSTDNQTVSPDNQEWAKTGENDNKPIAKDDKISILLEKMATERDEIKDQLWQERYEKQQLAIANEKLQNKLSEVIEQKTALEYDENKLQVNDDIKDFVHFYNKRSTDKAQQTPDSVLTKRTLAEAVKVVEAITKLNLDGYLNQFYLASNPQIPKIWNNHYSIDNLWFDPSQKREKTIEEKKADPKWNPMEDRF